ncbi:MAG: hypothetical protein JNM40_09240 [Myxococcales bacterium]|nr:hypothetical protein [Myxococcales bacterium]
MIEFLDSEPLCASLEALGQARRLGSAVGMTVYALLPMQSVAPQARERLGQLLGHFGADAVVLLTAESPVHEHELRFAPYARALQQACEELPPKLFLMADTPGARDIAPRLTARIGGVFLASGEPTCEHGVLKLFDSQGQQVMPCDDPLADEMFAPTMLPVVMTLQAGRYALSRGSTAVPVRFMAPIDADTSSERTPVPGGGLSEDHCEPFLRSQRLWLHPPETIGPETIPPLFAVSNERLLLDRRSVHSLIAIGPSAIERADVQFALPLGDDAAKDLLESIDAAFARPKEPSVELNLSSLLSFHGDDDEELTPSTGRSWDGSDIVTGDTAPRQPVVSSSVASEESVAPVPRTEPFSSPFERTNAGSDEMWDGDPTPHSGQDAVPQAELDGIDTEPITELGHKDGHSEASKTVTSDDSSKRQEQS